MNKESGKAYDTLLDYVFQYIKDLGDTRLICEGHLISLLNSVEKGVIDRCDSAILAIPARTIEENEYQRKCFDALKKLMEDI